MNYTEDTETPVVCCAADDGYAMPLAVMLRSLAENAVSVARVNVYILDGGIVPENRANVERSLADSKLRLHWIRPDAGAVKGLPVFHYISACAYYRFLIPDLLPAAVERVIYLDIDLLVSGDIGVMWRFSLQDKAVLAVDDVSGPMVKMPHLRTFFRNVPDAESRGYFNSGVLVLNLAKWRREQLAARIMAYIAANKEHVRYWDQDGLNALLFDDWAKLPPEWNQQLPGVYRGMRAKEYIAAMTPVSYPAGILHFICAQKPWQFGTLHELVPLYFSYVDRTAWAGWRPMPRFRDRRKHWGALLRNRYFYTGMVRRMLGVGCGK